MKFRQPKKRRQPLDPATVLIIKQGLLGLAIFSILALIITAVWYGTRMTSLTITNITALGGETIKPEVVIKMAEEELRGTYLGIVPKRFSFFYPELVVQTKVAQIPRIKDVVVEREDGQNLIITYSEYSPDALWCGSDAAKSCYFLDATGYAFGVAPDLLGGSFVRYHSLQSEPALGTSPFAEEDYQATKKFAKLLAKTGWYVAKVEIDSARDVFYTLSPGSELKASLKVTPEEVFRHLETLRLSPEFLHLAPGNFQYVDLRFGTKIFVNEELPIDILEGVASGTATSTGEEIETTDVTSEGISPN